MTSNRENISVAGPARRSGPDLHLMDLASRIIMIANLNFQAQPWIFFQYREPVPGYLPAEQWSFMAPRGAPREPPTGKPLFFSLAVTLDPMMLSLPRDIRGRHPYRCLYPIPIPPRWWGSRAMAAKRKGVRNFVTSCLDIAGGAQRYLR